QADAASRHGLILVLGPGGKYVASSDTALLEALRDRDVRCGVSRIRMLAVHATSCAQRAGLVARCGNRSAGRLRSRVGAVRFGFPEEPACSYPGRSALDSGGLGCLVLAQGLTMSSSRSRFVTQSTWQVQLAMCFAPLRSSA